MSCPFCKRCSIMTSAPIDGTIRPCNRWIYKSDHCYAVLKPEQHTIGDSIVILNKHKKDITDDISPIELSDFMNTIKIVATRIKNVARNNNMPPDRIYVGILCDGVEIQHLHAHLIPRYPFTPDDEAKYKDFFIQRDGENEIMKKIKRRDLGGYWYIFDKERTYYQSEYGQKDTKDKVIFLEKLANSLRSSSLVRI
jgi:diadenosine tetraphosphate (Ap4A) HIT family hydrolase